MSIEELVSEIWRFQNLYNIKNSKKAKQNKTKTKGIAIKICLKPEIEYIFPTLATTSLLSLNTNMIWCPVES